MGHKIYALVDCDSFFVSCEQVLNPKIKNFPVCVLSNNMGCVVARSVQAKEMGIEMGMPYFKAKQQYPGAIYLRGEHKIYEEFSKKVMNILRDFSPNVEVYSIDEAFVDLCGTKRMHKKNYYKIAQEMKCRIKTEIGIDVSIGLSITKTLAKLASERAKKQPYTKIVPRKGIHIIGKSKIKKELATTKIGEVWGVGSNTKKFLTSYGMSLASDFVKQEDIWIKQKLGKRGLDLKNELIGNAVSEIVPTIRKPKSIQITRSFMQASSDKEYIKTKLKQHIKNACKKLREEGGKAKSVVTMLKRKDFVMQHKRDVFDTVLDFELDISKFVLNTFEELFENGVLYRSCGVTLDVITFEGREQLNLFKADENKKSDRLSKSIDKIEELYGSDTIKIGY